MARNKQPALLRNIKKASRRAPFTFSARVYLLLLFLPVPFCHAAFASDHQNCSTQHFQETVTANYVYDGDTIHLADGRKIRLIGINTTEHGRDGKADEPFYLAAKIRLQQLIKDAHGQLKLVYGKEKHDHYHRLLANIFTLQGQNINAELLRQGLGFSIAMPPNIKFLGCYREAEAKAKSQKKGLWNDPFGQPIEVANLNKSLTGFRQVIGTVQRIGKSRSAIWLNLGKNFALRIPRKDLGYFTSYAPASLLQKRIIARGWIYKVKNEQRISIRHPASIQVQNTD